MNRIKEARVDANFRRRLAEEPGAERISSCFVCGTCAVGCPITKVHDRFNPARVIRLALLGLKEEVLSSAFIWLCSGCYTCQERCPHGVWVSDFMMVLKNLAAREGRIPGGVKTQMKIIKAEGRIYPVDEFDNRKRLKLGLPLLATSCEVVKDLFSHEKESE